MSASTFPVNYALVEDIQQTFPAVNSVTTIDSAVMAYQLGRAESLINAKLSINYTVPTTPVPLLTMIATDLAIWELAKRIYSGVTLKDSAWAVRYSEANSLLAQLADGSLPLTTASGTLITMDKNTQEVYSSTSGYVPTFQEDDWSDSDIDSNKLDDIDAART